MSDETGSLIGVVALVIGVIALLFGLGILGTAPPLSPGS